MSFQTLAKSLATLMAANGLGATSTDGAVTNPPAGTTDGTKTPEELEAKEAAAAAAKAAADAAAAAAANPGTGDGATPLGKSMTFTLEDGTQIEAFDGGEMLKALSERVDSDGESVKKLLGQTIMLLSTQNGQIAELTKSLTEAGALVKSQGETITTLRADFDALRNEPAGRKSVTNPAGAGGGTPLAKSLNNGGDGDGLPPNEFLAKCLDLQKEGRMTLQEVATAEAAIGSGVAVPDGIRTKVFSTK